MVLSTFRVDTTDLAKVQNIIDGYLALHPGTKYCINSEISDIEHKQHYQGWFDIPDIKKQAVFGDFMRKRFTEIQLGKHKYSFAKVKDPPTYYAYILNNEMKPDTSYTTVVTNFTEEEFDQYKNQKKFVKLPDVPKGRKSTTKTYQCKVLDALEEHCLKDGKIQYSKIPGKYLQLAPQLQMDKTIAFKNTCGYTLRLENLHPDPDNTLITDYLYDGIIFDSKQKFTPFHPEYRSDFNPDYNIHIQK